MLRPSSDNRARRHHPALPFPPARPPARTPQALDLRTVGYSGLMLPVMEDSLLAERCSQRTFSIGDCLMYSSVCGVGIDTVPVPGAVR